MKIFYISARVELMKKPEWLDGFRAKHDKPYVYHVTLKQPCNIADDEVEEVKAKFEKFLEVSRPGPITMVFDELVHDYSPSGICIMINTKDQNIRKLHAGIFEALGEYSHYLKPMYQKFENSFQPHITIARELDEDGLTKALEEILEDSLCEGIIRELVFLVMSEKTVEQASDPNNQTVYQL